MKKFLHKKIQRLYEEFMIFFVFFVSIILFCSVLYAANAAVDIEEARKVLSEVRQNIVLSRERVSFLKNQVEDLKRDQHALSVALIKVAKEERAIESDIAEREEKLKKMITQRVKVQQDLKNRRTEVAAVVAILERMGLNPPPALILQPGDALTSVRSSILLGVIVSKLQEKTRVLTEILKELTHLTNSITTEYAVLKTKIQHQAEQRKYLQLLLDKKAKLQQKSEEELKEQQQKNIALSKKVQSLEELILELNRQSKLNSGVSMEVQKKLQALEKSNFESRKGSLFLPVSGKRTRYTHNNSQMTRFGEMIETEESAIVVSPADAVVVFAGPFRSYKQLIILNVGNGYHIILTGMSKINVRQGQFVLAGEPLGVMGMQFIANSAVLDIGKTAPMLYIEFRKQGRPVNPTPWWRTETTRRNQNDS